MATAHLIHGFIGAGKTTFARRLERRLPAIRFTHDEWMSRLYGTNPAPEHFAEFFRKISAQILDVWPRCLELGIDVVLDLAFWTRDDRDQARAVAARWGGTARLYRLRCADHVAWQRVQARNLKLDGSLYISSGTFEALKSRFQPLGANEERLDVARDDGALDPQDGPASDRGLLP